MGGTRILECSFLIPIRRDAVLSDGRPHARATWHWLMQQLFAFEGATRSKELYEGWYLDPDTGEPVEDRSRKYFVAIPRSRVEELREVLRRACREFQQKCIYLSVAGQVEFISGDSDDPD